MPWPHAYSVIGAAAPYELALAWRLPVQRPATCAAAAAQLAGQLHPASWLQRRGSRSLPPPVLPAVPAGTAGVSDWRSPTRVLTACMPHPADMLWWLETLGGVDPTVWTCYVNSASRLALDPNAMPTAVGLDHPAASKSTAHGCVQPGLIQWWHHNPTVLSQLDQHPKFRNPTAVGPNTASSWIPRSGAPCPMAGCIGYDKEHVLDQHRCWPFAALQHAVATPTAASGASPAAPCCGGAAAP